MGIGAFGADLFWRAALKPHTHPVPLPLEGDGAFRRSPAIPAGLVNESSPSLTMIPQTGRA